MSSRICAWTESKSYQYAQPNDLDAWVCVRTYSFWRMSLCWLKWFDPFFQFFICHSLGVFFFACTALPEQEHIRSVQVAMRNSKSSLASLPLKSLVLELSRQNYLFSFSWIVYNLGHQESSINFKHIAVIIWKCCKQAATAVCLAISVQTSSPGGQPSSHYPYLVHIIQLWGNDPHSTPLK